jgi:antitoxin VapB
MSMAKIFKNGRSQAVRLPKEFRLKGNEVSIKRVPGGILLSESDPWEICRQACEEISTELLDNLEKRDQPNIQNRD